MVEATQEYEVPFLYRKKFSPEESTEMVKSFKNYDVNKDGHMDKKEFKAALVDMGHRDVTDERITELMKNVDQDGSGVIEWAEFLDMMLIIKESGKQSIGAALDTKFGGKDAVTQEHKDGSKATFLIEEVSTAARQINKVLKDNEDCKAFLPINPDQPQDLFDVMSDGFVGINMLNVIDKERIDMRTVNKGGNLNVFKVRQNLSSFFAGCKGMIRIVGIDGQSFLDKNKTLMLAVIWQLVAKIALFKINVEGCKEIICLLEDGEEPADLLKLKPEEILKRWMNWHLVKAGQPKINNLGKDLKDSKGFLYVLNQLDKGTCSLDGLNEEDDVKRAQAAIDSSFALGCGDVVGANDICKGNDKVNVILVAEMFNTKHGLDATDWDPAGLLDDGEGSREERAYRFWINSLDIEGVFVDNLYEDLKDGLILCKVIHRIDDKVIEWPKVVMQPKNVFNRLSNCQCAVDGAAKLKVQLVGIGNSDIHDGNRKLVLAIVWQLVRLHALQIIGSKTEDDLLAWVSETEPVTKFNDEKFRNGRLLIQLCAKIEPKVINWDLVYEGKDEQEQADNARYAISVARKLGAIIFCVHDDIVALNKKMILVFVCALYDLKHN
jgi:hypothetical protein